MVSDIPLSPSALFQGKADSEHFQFYFRQHWIRLVRPLLRMLAGTALLVGAGYVVFFVLTVPDSTSRHGLLVALLLLFTILQLSFLHRFYIYFLYVIVVTDRRVHRIKKTLFSIDDHQTIDIWTFQDIDKLQRGPLQNLFGFGSLTLEAQNTTLRIHFVPRINKIQERISHLRELARDEQRMTKTL